jgi:hypothetical protein
MSVFFAPVRYRVVKITYSNSEVVLRTIKHTMFYPASCLFSMEIVYVQRFDIEYEHVLQGVSRELEKFMR